MKTEITGKIIVVGNNIDTDQIYPGRFLAITDPKEIGSHCLCGVDEEIAANFPQGESSLQEQTLDAVPAVSMHRSRF